MDAEYGQGQLQRPVYDEETQQGVGTVTGQGGEEKTKMPMLRKVKDKVKAPVKKIKHTIGKKSKNHDDKQGDDKLASPDNVEYPDPEEEGGYEEDDEEQEVDPELHGLAGERDEKVDADPSLTQSFQRMAVSDQPENVKQTEQDEKHRSSTEPMQEDQHNPGEASPNQDQKNQSYTTKISAAAAGLASTVYGKAANAGTLLKEKVAKPSGSPTDGQQLSDQSATDQAQQQPGYAQKVYAAIQPAKDRAAALAAVAKEKAAGAGAVAKEKAAVATEAAKGKAAGASDVAKEKAAAAQARAGQTAAGAKSTISEKLKPGEEEKALSQVIADMISTRKDTAKEKAGEARNIGAEKAAHARDIGAEKAKEQTAVAKEKANELKGKTVEAKDVGTEKTKEKAAEAREGTDNSGTPMVEKIKGAVTSLFGTRASTDDQAQAATEKEATREATE